MVMEHCGELTDNELVGRVLGGESYLYELLMRRHNQRLFRVIRSVIADDLESEDVLQDAWVRAYEHLDQFEGRAGFPTWVSKIAFYEALARVRKAKRFTALENGGDEMAASYDRSDPGTPEEQAIRGELGRTLRSAVDRLPQTYRSVFVLREVEGMSTSETADCLDLSEEAVKTRLHRARALLRRDLEGRIGPAIAEAYQFLGTRCDRVVARVMERIRLPR
jgi:RNA polymerase sigma-70 factor (ECF subfamily)